MGVNLFLKLLWCACKGCYRRLFNFRLFILSDNVRQMVRTPSNSVNRSNRLLGDYRTLN